MSAGVVICNPFGFEAICAHRSLRHLAEMLAAAGLSTLRFDYDGTGDSAGSDRDPNRVEAWVESVRVASHALRTSAGVERVWLVGLRLGALIATLAAVDEPNVAGLVAIAPVVSGRAYLRELSVLQTTLELEEPLPGSRSRTAVEDGGQEALGFAISAATRTALAEVQLAKLSWPRAHAGAARIEALVLDRDDLPVADKWSARLAEQGVVVDARRVSGYLEMMLDPHKSVVPTNILRDATTWLAERSEKTVTGGTSAPLPRTEAVVEGVIERPVFIGPNELVFGVLARPQAARPSGRSILLLNAGSIHHIGPNRLYVQLARAWAAAGHEVLRLDISGIGESGVRDGQEENVVYSAHALEDVEAAVRFFRDRRSSDVRPVGLCSGAFFAMKTGGVEGVSGFVAINPLAFDQPPPGPTDYPKARVARDTARYRRSLRDVEKWKKLFRGRVRMKTAAKTIAQHVATRFVKQARDVSRRLRIPWKNDVGAELSRLAQSSVEQWFVFAGSDPGRYLLRDEAGPVLDALQREGALKIDVIDRTDHTFTALWSHGPLAEVLTAAITPGASRPKPRT